MNNRFKTYWLILLVCTSLLWGCKKDKSTETGTWLQVQLVHRFGSQPLALGQAYNTAAGEPFTPITFKYYLSGFSLQKADGSEQPLAAAYFLINEATDSTKNIKLQLPEGSYRSLRFWVGVDSARNVSGVQEGALDPANGMFWTWNSGYIFAKLEGRSAVSPAALQAVTYHVGGFRTGENALRQVTIPLGGTFALSKTSQYKVVLATDVATWFSGKTNISIATQPATMSPGPLALQLADNYAGMFSLQQVVKL